MFSNKVKKSPAKYGAFVYGGVVKEFIFLKYI